MCITPATTFITPCVDRIDSTILPPTHERDHENYKEKLPASFQPSKHSVILGRGKVYTDSVGNKRLRVLASLHLDEYTKATTKNDKSAVVSRVVEEVRAACPMVGAFIKRDKYGCWWETDELAAREKVGYVLRDLLHSNYKSSSKSKIARRRKQRGEESAKEAASTNNTAMIVLTIPPNPKSQCSCSFCH
jgi:hypothetical protein